MQAIPQTAWDRLTGLWDDASTARSDERQAAYNAWMKAVQALVPEPRTDDVESVVRGLCLGDP